MGTIVLEQAGRPSGEAWGGLPTPVALRALPIEARSAAGFSPLLGVMRCRRPAVPRGWTGEAGAARGLPLLRPDELPERGAAALRVPAAGETTGPVRLHVGDCGALSGEGATGEEAERLSGRKASSPRGVGGTLGSPGG
jgi:hypothetical protein